MWRPGDNRRAGFLGRCYPRMLYTCREGVLFYDSSPRSEAIIIVGDFTGHMIGQDVHVHT